MEETKEAARRRPPPPLYVRPPTPPPGSTPPPADNYTESRPPPPPLTGVNLGPLARDGFLPDSQALAEDKKKERNLFMFKKTFVRRAARAARRRVARDEKI